MKYIKKIKDEWYTRYYYENNINVSKWRDGGIFWRLGSALNNEHGAAIENCIFCKIKECYYYSIYNRHFYLNHESCYPTEFAQKTNHIVCDICYDFCNQECFI